MQIDYDSMTSIYENLNSLTKDLNDSVNDAKSVVNKMDNRDHWDGNGYNRYKEKFNSLANSFSDYVNVIYSINNRIKTSIDYYKTVDSAMQSAVTQVK